MAGLRMKVRMSSQRQNASAFNKCYKKQKKRDPW